MLHRLTLLCLLFGAAACGDGSSSDGSSGDGGASPDTADTTGATDDGETPAAPADELAAPVADVAAATRAFQLYYRERVERAVVAHQRFGVFGDVSFGTAIDRAWIAVEGDEVEVIGGPKDNNLTGTAAWTTWEAYRLFGGRTLALAAIRLFDGLAYQEAVPGHEGMTSREVLPGWTRVVDGAADTVTRTRDGAPVQHPWPPDPTLEAEMIAAFWSDRRYTYREDPSEFIFAFSPAGDLADYAKTHSFDMLPDYLHVTNCCSSFKRTPDDRPWAGAFWGNHNSRDNFPDLALGALAAREAADDGDVDPQVVAAAARAAAAGVRSADLVQEHDGAIMTVDEWNDYETLVISGTVRPHGAPEVENGDLGSMSSCPMAFLARALSTAGLDASIPTVPIPAAPESALLGTDEANDLAVVCEVPEGPPSCAALGQAYCGLTWETVYDLEILGQPWLEVAALLDEGEPGTAAELLGSFQNDYDDVVESMSALVRYAQISDQPALEEATRTTLGHMTELMRTFADVVWASTQPAKQALQRYEAAIFDALGGRPVVAADVADFAVAEQRIAAIEAALDVELQDTEPWPLLTDQQIFEEVEADLAGEKLDSVVQRYRDAYGQTPPVRRAGDGYEARGFPEEARPWTAVERPRHAHVGSMKLLQALPLCRYAPELLDCTWAIAGCGRADLDADGDVDAEDRAAFEALRAGAPESCGSADAWCGGADLDRTGVVDDTDQAFIEAAEGCWY